MLILPRCYFMYFHAYTCYVMHAYLQIHFNTDGIIGWNYSTTVSCHFVDVGTIWRGTFQSTSLSLSFPETYIMVNDNEWNTRHSPFAPGSPPTSPSMYTSPHLTFSYTLPFHLMVRLLQSKAFWLFFFFNLFFSPTFHHLLFIFIHWVVYYLLTDTWFSSWQTRNV